MIEREDGPPESSMGLIETVARAICGERADEMVQAGNIIGEPCDYPAWMLAQPEARRVVAAIEGTQAWERLRTIGPTDVDVVDEFRAFTSWWKRTIPNDVPGPSSYYFDTWLAATRAARHPQGG